jgi:hypothetical protein
MKRANLKFILFLIFYFSSFFLTNENTLKSNKSFWNLLLKRFTSTDDEKLNFNLYRKVNNNVKSKNIQPIDDKLNQKIIKNSEILLSINLIANPHYFPDYGLNLDNKDPFGNEYKNVNNWYAPGEITEIGKKQMEEVAEKINKKFHSYKIENSNSTQNVSNYIFKDQILTIGMKLKRSIDGALILNHKLLELNNFKIKSFKIKKLNLSEFNSTINDSNYSIKNPIKKNNSDVTYTYFIPSSYEKTVLPFNFHLKKCAKLLQLYEQHLNSTDVLKMMLQYFHEIKNAYTKMIKYKTFDKFNNKEYYSYFNFSDYNLNFTFESNRILTDYYLTYEAMKSTDKIILNQDFKKWDEHALLFQKISVLHLKSYDNFFVKNFSDDFGKIYLNGFFKFILRLLYSKLDPTVNDRNSKMKIVNFIVHEYNIAGVYKSINSNLMSFKEEDLEDITKLPKINYGSILSLNILQNKSVIQEGDSITASIFIEVLFDNNLVQLIKLSDFIDRVNLSMPTDETFFDYLC